MPKRAIRNEIATINKTLLRRVFDSSVNRLVDKVLQVEATVKMLIC